MVWWIQTREISENGEPSGKWRLTAKSDEDGGGPYPLCDCEHTSEQEAADCPKAREKAAMYG